MTRLTAFRRGIVDRVDAEKSTASRQVSVSGFFFFSPGKVCRREHAETPISRSLQPRVDGAAKQARNSDRANGRVVSILYPAAI